MADTTLHLEDGTKVVLPPELVSFEPWGVKTRPDAEAKWNKLYPWHRVELVTVDHQEEPVGD